MTITTIADGTTVQSQQNGSPSDVYLLTGSSTIVGAGAGTFFGSNNPTSNDTFYLTGISAQPNGYVGDVAVLGAGHSTVLLGGLNPVVFGGTGTADIFWGTAPATLVTGTGNINVVGNPTGAGIDFTSGVHDVQRFNGGSIVHENDGAQVILWAAGPTS